MWQLIHSLGKLAVSSSVSANNQDKVRGGYDNPCFIEGAIDI